MLSVLLNALACVPPDRPDFGTCGTACCKLLLSFPNTSSVALMTALNTSLAGGGPDGRFKLMPTAEDPYGFGDLRPVPPGPGLVHWPGHAPHGEEDLHRHDRPAAPQGLTLRHAQGVLEEPDWRRLRRRRPELQEHRRAAQGAAEDALHRAAGRGLQQRDHGRRGVEQQVGPSSGCHCTHHVVVPRLVQGGCRPPTTLTVTVASRHTNSGDLQLARSQRLISTTQPIGIAPRVLRANERGDGQARSASHPHTQKIVSTLPLAAHLVAHGTAPPRPAERTPAATTRPAWRLTFLIRTGCRCPRSRP